jgi:hypothetical protein
VTWHQDSIRSEWHKRTPTKRHFQRHTDTSNSGSKTDGSAGEEAVDQEVIDVETASEEKFSTSDSESTRQRGEIMKPTILTELRISETRDTITTVKDHKMIFIDTQGNSIDKGTLEMKEIGKLPHYEHLMLARARLSRDSGKYIVSLPVKEDRSVPTTPENLLNSLRSLLDVVNEKQLTSFSVSKGNLEKIPWRHTIRKLKEVFMGSSISITICTGVITSPVETRGDIIRKKHESSVARHKGVTKTYQRIRQHYYLENMKKGIEECVRTCRMPVKETD